MQRYCRKLGLALLLGALPAHATSAPDQLAATVTVDVSPRGLLRTLLPGRAMGAGIDGQQRGSFANIDSPGAIAAMRSAGFGPLSYRLRTELGIEAWHWNPRGVWSDADRSQGYWTSDSRPGEEIRLSFGYRLPRRGNTLDQANDDGYSRLDDGDRRTYWKSNPYLDRYYTGQENKEHPQWMVFDLGEAESVDAIRIAWAEPYARRYRVQWWDGDNEFVERPGILGVWRDFPAGVVGNGRGGESMLRLCAAPVHARVIRVLMTEASGSAPAGCTDVRDRLGFAVREVYIGNVDSSGAFRDLLRHGADKARQSLAYVSSTDPWHRATDIDLDTEQPGIDFAFRSGLTNNQPMLVTAGAIYDTPGNAAALLRYIMARGYPVRQFELGEEPDQQFIDGRDFGAIYVQYARALHAIDPQLQVGGPSLEEITTDVHGFPADPGSDHWLAQFTGFLRGRGHLDALGFFSFEWYPFDHVCEPPGPQLARLPATLAAGLARAEALGVPKSVPWLLTEYGYSAFGARIEDETGGAIFNAETVAEFLGHGGTTAYYYGYEPNCLLHEAPCDNWGNNMLFLLDDDNHIAYRTATYFGARLMTGEWAQPGGTEHELYRATSDIVDGAGNHILTAYALHRPDGRWSVLLLNKDMTHTYTVRVRFTGATHPTAWRGPLDFYRLSTAEYNWHNRGEHSYPDPDGPPSHALVNGSDPLFVLPPLSMCVVRGRLG